MCTGRAPAYPEPLTRAELEADTDNEYENPGSGTETPDWKKDKPEEELKADTSGGSGQTSSDNYGG